MRWYTRSVPVEDKFHVAGLIACLAISHQHRAQSVQIGAISHQVILQRHGQPRLWVGQAETLGVDLNGCFSRTGW